MSYRKIVSPQLCALAEDRLQRLFERAKKHLQTHYPDAKLISLIYPQLHFNQRGKVAGSALLQKNIIKLNPVLYLDNVDYYLHQVIAHELAHILVFQLYKTNCKPHGAEWQSMMRDVFNLIPDVTHQLDVSKVGSQSFPYHCACQHVSLSIIRHNKVLKGKQLYMCKRCKEPFKWKKIQADKAL